MGAATPTSSARAGRTASLSPGRAGAISPARASPQRRAFPGYDVGHSPRLIEHRAGAADRGLLAGSPGRGRSGGRSPPAPSVPPAARSSSLSADTFGGARSSRPSLTLDSPGHHHSLGAPRRPGTRLADTGRLTPGSAAGIGQQQVLTGSVTRTPSPMRTAPLPPREWPRRPAVRLRQLCAPGPHRCARVGAGARSQLRCNCKHVDSSGGNAFVVDPRSMSNLAKN